MSDLNTKIVFAEGQGQGDGARFLLLGIPEGAWEYMKDGKTHTFDLTKIGLPVKLILYGAKDHGAALYMIKDYLAGTGQVALDLRSADFSIKPREPSA